MLVAKSNGFKGTKKNLLEKNGVEMKNGIIIISMAARLEQWEIYESTWFA